jgi:hypothetical protein
MLQAIETSLLPSGEVLAEHAYLIARGVRPLAIACHFFVEELDPLMAVAAVEEHSYEGLIPWALDHGDGVGSCGYAREKWAIDLYEWAVKKAPDEQREQIIGLLLGYSDYAIGRFTAEGTGRRFVSALLEPMSN